MNNYYDIRKWEEQSSKGLFIWKFFFAGRELPGFKLKEVITAGASPRFPIKEYYWQNDKTEGESIKIDVLEYSSAEEARLGLLNELHNHMAHALPELSTRGIRLGDVAYTGMSEVLQHILFIRANLLIVMNSIGNKNIPVVETAQRLDEWIAGKPRTIEKGVVPVIHSFSMDDQGSYIKDKRSNLLRVEAADPLERPLWFKFFAESGELFSQEGQVFYNPVPGKTSAITVYAINENGMAASQNLNN